MRRQKNSIHCCPPADAAVWRNQKVFFPDGSKQVKWLKEGEIKGRKKWPGNCDRERCGKVVEWRWGSCKTESKYRRSRFHTTVSQT